ncbi:helix-turn-helix transcriptional regulator [Sporolactobacillus sp. CQH2019]|jgi:DNA-binding XRE family transcriptional regulator|uniref:helix-turn-helix domain-containing protein n=1 Tax=Sporolactobacillus sp. CQH2019 TaxID=3023512 RepID=UPI0023674BB1|nr:helix-turn-helix transcriptional regulator [Sporolactobacillus sp. CQH2019]MBE6087904.1 helix-turn-helix transcriptional regulator [Clostridium beijerinckii]MDD9150892.1 helix-turn-helix transcriptional regulator [Sporolactobacillus sp. CQH2019]
MGFKRVDCVKEMDKMIKEDSQIAKYVDEFNKEYEVMQSIVKVRKELGLTQKDVSKRSGLTQQMVSRMEKVDNSPTLTNFIKYITAIGLDLDLVKKQNS